jgi:hypothetical protein
MENPDKLIDKFVTHVQQAIDLMVHGGEDQYPAMGDVIAKSGIATHKQLEIMEKMGYIKSVTIDVPSVLVPSQTVKAKAYYTEERIPELVKALVKPQSFSIEGKN